MKIPGKMRCCLLARRVTATMRPTAENIIFSKSSNLAVDCLKSLVLRLVCYLSLRTCLGQDAKTSGTPNENHAIKCRTSNCMTISVDIVAMTISREGFCLGGSQLGVEHVESLCWSPDCCDYHSAFGRQQETTVLQP